jgi:hypothetical protein
MVSLRLPTTLEWHASDCQQYNKAAFPAGFYTREYNCSVVAKGRHPAHDAGRKTRSIFVYGETCQTVPLLYFPHE